MTAIEYTIYEQPQPPDVTPPGLDKPILENPTPGNPILENPTPGKPTTENPMQLNKDIVYLGSMERGIYLFKSLFNISACMDWRVDFLPCKAKIRRHPDGWQGFLTQSGRKIRRQDMRGEILNRL